MSNQPNPDLAAAASAGLPDSALEGDPGADETDAGVPVGRADLEADRERVGEDTDEDTFIGLGGKDDDDDAT